ncbi:hypothetical protein J4573_08160 [Actinomadura barringtoniae]|uniref:Uncharacterized protein n=1 Tax=Actinomadura barringtoniae TaxID=1427535 RepID=A0A939P7P9_9ACTN|nr:hypothetical protein [Actinomadura barringtoniae]MBO2447060.1 hypothetical protein [Actinomadura barringtoniae]
MDLSAPEQALWSAFPRGEWADAEGAEIPADVITALLLGAAEPEPGGRAAVRLLNARVTGRLDLMGGTARYPLICERSTFTAPLRFVETTTRTIRLIDCDIPSMERAVERPAGRDRGVRLPALAGSPLAGRAGVHRGRGVRA